MNFKVLFRVVFFLAILFVMLYIGMYNTKQIGFEFPLAFARPIQAPAGIIFFAVFAVGMLGGAVLTGGGSGGGRSKSSAKDK